MYRGIVLAIAALIFPVAADAVESARWQGSYSNVCMHPESGDLLGDAVSFIPYAGGMAMLLQRFEGEALAPQLLILREHGGIAVGAEAEGAPPVIRLTREQTRLRVRYLDGQQDSPEGSLRPIAAPLWTGARFPECR